MVQSLLEFPNTCSQCVVLRLKAFSFVHAGERCAQVVFVQVIANEINQQIPVKAFYQAGIAVALPYGCI
jgi:hypothetical protein